MFPELNAITESDIDTSPHSCNADIPQPVPLNTLIWEIWRLVIDANHSTALEVENPLFVGRSQPQYRKLRLSTVSPNIFVNMNPAFSAHKTMDSSCFSPLIVKFSVLQVQYFP